jgi:hypothetical protein
VADLAPASHGGALLAGLLAEHGVRHVFGVPGGQTLALYDAILDREPALRHVLVRDERSGPGRRSCRPASPRPSAPRCRWSPW